MSGYRQSHAVVVALALLALSAEMGWVAAVLGPTTLGALALAACAWMLVVLVLWVAPVALWDYPYAEDP